MSLITDSACDSSPVRCYNGQNPVTEQLLPLIWQHTTSASTFWQNEHTGIYGMSNTQPFPDNWLSHKNSSFLLADKHVPFTDTGAKRWLQTLNNALNTVMQPADPRSEAQYGKPQNQPPFLCSCMVRVSAPSSPCPKLRSELPLQCFAVWTPSCPFSQSPCSAWGCH